MMAWWLFGANPSLASADYWAILLLFSLRFIPEGNKDQRHCHGWFSMKQVLKSDVSMLVRKGVDWRRVWGLPCCFLRPLMRFNLLVPDYMELIGNGMLIGKTKLCCSIDYHDGGPVPFTWGEFHRKCLPYESLNLLETIHLKLQKTWTLYAYKGCFSDAAVLYLLFADCSQVGSVRIVRQVVVLQSANRKIKLSWMSVGV